MAIVLGTGVCLLCGLSGDRLSFATFFKKRDVTVSGLRGVGPEGCGLRGGHTWV